MIKPILTNIKHNSHHLSRYIKFIENCNQQTISDNYTEIHHICPRALFPEYMNLNLFAWNSITLTARQHFIAHWMLWKAFGGSQTIAFKMMCNRTNFRPSSRVYSSLKESYSKRLSDQMRRRIKIDGHMKGMLGKNHRIETKEKYSTDRSGSGNSMFGRYHSDETKQNWSTKRRGKYVGSDNPNYGNQWSSESRAAMSEKKKGMVTVFDKSIMKTVTIPMNKFELYRTVRYIGTASKEAKLLRKLI